LAKSQFRHFTPYIIGCGSERGRDRSELRWLTFLLQKSWYIAWDVWDHRNWVLHDTEHSIARDLQVQQITAPIQMGIVGLPTVVNVHFRRGLQALLQQQPVYQTAWLIRIQAARARAEQGTGQDIFGMERVGLLRWLDQQQLRSLKRIRRKEVTKRLCSLCVAYYDARCPIGI
jgi:hypothetical protein